MYCARGLLTNRVHSDSIAISLQSLDDLRSELAQVSVDLGSLTDQVTRASGWVDEIRTAQQRT